jgi:hypothetical protein
MEILLMLLIFIAVVVIAAKRSHPAQPKGLGAVFGRKCPHCRTPISGFAKVCAYCGQSVESKRPVLEIVTPIRDIITRK